MTVAFRRDWINSGAISQLLKRLNEGTDSNANGGITFVADDYRDLFFLLADCIKAPSDVTRNDISAVSYRAYLDLRKQGNVRSSDLISEIAKRIAHLRSKSPKRFTMWTKLRLRQMAHSRGSRFQCNDVNVEIKSRLPKWLMLDKHFISGVGEIDPNTLPEFGYVIFRTEARNENEASRKIFEALDLFFAVVNTSFRTIPFWEQRHSSAQLCPGPYYFFFEGRNFIGNNKVWYNNNFEEKEWLRFPESARKFVTRLREYRRVLDALENHPLELQLSCALVLISEGMISKDLSYRLMRFWSAAESLYSSENEKTSYSKLIDRMVFAIRDDRLIEKLKLERAYHIRNSYVHQGANENDDSSLVLNLREVIISFVHYLIFNGGDIENHGDLLMMLDLPSEENALNIRLRAIERRLRISQTGRHFE